MPTEDILDDITFEWLKERNRRRRFVVAIVSLTAQSFFWIIFWWNLGGFFRGQDSLTYIRLLPVAFLILNIILNHRYRPPKAPEHVSKRP